MDPYKRRQKALGQGLRKNPMKYSIVNTVRRQLCVDCGDATETVKHIVSGGKKLLAQREYKKRHDRVALRLHLEMCRKHGIECTHKCYDHHNLSVVENYLGDDYLHRQSVEALLSARHYYKVQRDIEMDT